VSKRGLPTGLKMRHDAHYVEELAQHRPTPVGRLVSIEQLDPNPGQPRVEIGDLAELTASIKEKGVLEPLLVKPSRLTGRWMIIAGERRWRAARDAGLREVPCIEMDVDDRAVAEIALIENMQRKDLTPWEEADGLKALSERFGYTHDDIAKKVGKSRSTITEALSIAGLPAEIRGLCRHADITAKSMLLQIVRQPDDESMRAMIDAILHQGLTREDARAARKAQALPAGERPRSKPFSFRFSSPNKDFKLEVKFNRSEVGNGELIVALKAAIEQLENEGKAAAKPTEE
jgi:ParB family transcriptional regulator, chromosome partitioning protein